MEQYFTFKILYKSFSPGEVDFLGLKKKSYWKELQKKRPNFIYKQRINHFFTSISHKDIFRRYWMIKLILLGSKAFSKDYIRLPHVSLVLESRTYGERYFTFQFYIICVASWKFLPYTEKIFPLKRVCSEKVFFVQNLIEFFFSDPSFFEGIEEEWLLKRTAGRSPIK